MAVPFNMPEDHNEVDVIVNQLQSLLTQLQASVRESQRSTRTRNPPGSTRHRVRFASGTRDRDPERQEETDGDGRPSHEHLADLMVCRHDVPSASTQLTASPIRRRTTRFQTDCDETKINITTIVDTGSQQDWAQIGITLRNIADDINPVTFREVVLFPTTKRGLLSKLPDALTCTIWTAMLGCVGWHLFRSR
ncbi:uncharacterized protein LOC109600879 [Aethina tumida]|uniref:uncharacterized protein LOC109600879 n=1 Tax=Aethina tumida TaxID=116153 RepID=UPI00096B5AC9|nr:uncharacterized protein LOC109600879 [Aethina tumida]